MKTKAELEVELKNYSKKRDGLIAEIKSCEGMIFEISDLLKSLDTKFVKIECVQCNGVGYLTGEDKKKHICNLCYGKKYNQMRKYNEK